MVVVVSAAVVVSGNVGGCDDADAVFICLIIVVLTLLVQLGMFGCGWCY